MLDRTVIPQINQIKDAAIAQAEEFTLKNGIRVFTVNEGTQDLVRIEWIFPAGMWQQPKPLSGSATAAMLTEGTGKMSSEQISEEVGFYGAFLHADITHDFAQVTLHTLNKHLERVLPIVREIITDAVFPEKEWELYLENKRASFKVNLEKVSFVSRKKFSELLFGASHPYGYNIGEADFDRIKRDDALHFYSSNYSAKGALILAAGKIDERVKALLKDHFSDIRSNDPVESKIIDESGRFSGPILVEKKDALQSAIRMGKMLFTKGHPDYPGMLVLNTVFGGYFGSRLMANIREDKGYTYGIGSAVVSFTKGGYFTLSTEVGAEVTQKAVDEIYFELKRIQTDLIPEAEMELVRNYMLGTFLRSIDGPFALADRFKGIFFHGLGYDYYDRYIQTVRSISPSALRDLANKYLKKEELIELVVGKMQ